jgi:anti-sigma factor RsiW
MSCPHRFDVGVYVLGALEPAEREAFEAHLPGCPACARSLGEVAGLPGLLARSEVPGPPEAPDPPPDLLAGTLRRIRRRRRAARAVAAAAVMVALLAGVGIAGWSAASAPATARELALPPVAASESSGTAGLTARPWGTQIALTCRYLGEPRPAPAPDAPRTTYVLVVRTPEGGEQEIARWSPPPGQDVTVTAATDLPPELVRGLEVRTATGQAVMRS